MNPAKTAGILASATYPPLPVIPRLSPGIPRRFSRRRIEAAAPRGKLATSWRTLVMSSERLSAKAARLVG
jgi:hypothetical protein